MVLRGKWQGVSESRVPGGRGESVCVELSNSLRVRYARVLTNHRAPLRTYTNLYVFRWLSPTRNHQDVAACMNRQNHKRVSERDPCNTVSACTPELHVLHNAVDPNSRLVAYNCTKSLRVERVRMDTYLSLLCTDIVGLRAFQSLAERVLFRVFIPTWRTPCRICVCDVFNTLLHLTPSHGVVLKAPCQQWEP